MGRDVLAQTEDTLAEMCWCGHGYWHHTDSDTPVCYWPEEPEADGFGWEDGECHCDGWYPMNENPPDLEDIR